MSNKGIITFCSEMISNSVYIQTLKTEKSPVKTWGKTMYIVTVKTKITCTVKGKIKKVKKARVVIPAEINIKAHETCKTLSGS